MKITGKVPNTRRLNNTFLNDTWVKYNFKKNKQKQTNKQKKTFD